MAQITTKERTAAGTEATSAKCLACGYGNKAGEVSCSACGSSLDLKLCSACEAINASRAPRCHACGVEFAITEEKSMLPVVRLIPRPVIRRSKQLTALLVLPLGATLALAYYIYGGALGGSTDPVAMPKNVQKVHSPALPPEPAAKTAAPQPEPAAKAVAQQAKDVREVHAKPKEVRQSSPIPQQAKSVPPPAPVVRSASEISPPADKAAHPRVTHTRGTGKPVTAPLAASAATMNAAARPISGAGTRNDGCSEAVTALGFCNRQGER
jgi:hypothetical protein